MTKIDRRHVLLSLLALALLLPTASGQEQPAADRALLQKLLQRVETLEAELKKLKKAGKTLVPSDPKQQRLVALLETPFLGAPYYRTTGPRFFAAKLVLVNLNPKPVVIKPGDFRLLADGKAQATGELPSTFRSASFQVGTQSFQLSTLKPASVLTLPPGGTGSTWVVFHGLGSAPQVPQLTLKLGPGKDDISLDINAITRSRLGMDIRRIGPRGSLGLLTIDGSIDTINIASLVNELDTLATAGVVRSVIRFTSKAPVVESRIRSWLQQVASQAGRGNVRSNSPFPTIPATIRELHLAAFPGTTSRPTGTGNFPGPPQVKLVRNPFGTSVSSSALRVHRTTEAAVAAALRSAYRAIPRDELLKEIVEGDPLTRPAAVAAGGGRLNSEHLPVLLKLTRDDQPALALAAITALRHFGEPAAVARLTELANRNQPPLAAAAITSLAAARYPAAHQALLKLLENIDPKSRLEVVRTLAQHPRPAFAAALYGFTRDADPAICAAAMQALAGIGHPKLMDVLSEALKSTHPTQSNMALSILAKRTDRQSEELAMSHVLKRMEKTPPNAIMASLLNRTRDQRAIPLLLKHLAGSPANRSTVIKTLVQLGDETIGGELLKQYPKLPSSDRALVLTAMTHIDMAAFRKLADEALTSNNSSLVSSACQGLQADASVEAVEILVRALQTSKSSHTWNYTSNALAGIGTSSARQALEQARRNTNRNKRNYANNALRSLRQRSPGYQYVSMGRSYSQQLNWKMAIAQYDLAVKIDPRLAEAFSGRGNARLQMGEPLAKIREDFQKAAELDPFSSQATTGLAIVLVREGKLDAGLKYAEDARRNLGIPSSSTARQMQAYNLACVYSRAIEVLQKDTKLPGREQKLVDYRKRAIEELTKAVKAGYRNKTWMGKDPDLKPIHALPEFQALLGAANKKKVPPKPRLKAVRPR